MTDPRPACAGQWQLTPTNSSSDVNGNQVGAISETKDRPKQGQSPRAVRRAASLLGTFRAFWPITDETVPLCDLIQQACDDLPWLTAQAHAVLDGEGIWSIVPSSKVPGSGRVTATVLLYSAPAIQGRSPFDDSAGEVA